MTTLLARLLIAFVGIVSSQACTLCPNGGKLSNGNLIVYQDENGIPVTCNDVVQDLILNPDNCNAPDYHAFQVVCGCPTSKAGSCLGVCETGKFLIKPNQISPPFGYTCLVVDQILRGSPGDLDCDTSYPTSDLEVNCPCKSKVTQSPINLGSGNGGAGNQGMGMMSMSAGRQLRYGGLEEYFPPRAARGLAM